MANKQVEILLKAADQFSDATKKAELQFAAMKIKAESLNQTFDKLSKQHPNLSADEARAAAVALENAGSGAKKMGASLESSKNAASGLAQMLGVQLPQSATTFLAKSSAIGPILAGAFSTVGVVALIGAVAQLPDVFAKVSASITGWSDKAQKAYSDFIDANNKAQLSVLDLAISMDKAFGRGPEDSLKRVDAELLKVGQTITKIREEQNIGFTLLGAPTQVGQRSRAELDRAISKEIALQNELLAKQGELQQQIATEGERDRRETLDWILRTDKAAADFQRSRREDQLKTAQEFLDGQELMRSTTEEIQSGTIAAEKMLREHAIRTNEEYEAGLELMQSTTREIREGTAKAMDDMNDRAVRAAEIWTQGQETMAEVTAEIRNGTAETERMLKEGTKAEQEFIRTFRDGAGKVWDDFFIKGQSVFQNLTNSLKAFLNSIGRSLFQTLSTSLLFGSKGSNAGGLSGLLSLSSGGGLMGLAGKGAGALGLGSLLGLGGAGIAGGGAASVGAFAGIAGAGGALSAPGIAAPSLGLGPALGALATNPFTIAGAAAIAGAIAWAKSQAHHEASDFTKRFQDPFSNASQTGAFDTLFAQFTAAKNSGTLSPQTGQQMLDAARGLFNTFNQNAAEFAAKGSDEALVVRQAHATIDPLIQGILDQMLTIVQSLPGAKGLDGKPAPPMTITLNVDGKTFARLISPHFYAISKQERVQVVGAG